MVMVPSVRALCACADAVHQPGARQLTRVQPHRRLDCRWVRACHGCETSLAAEQGAMCHVVVCLSFLAGSAFVPGCVVPKAARRAKSSLSLAASCQKLVPGSVVPKAACPWLRRAKSSSSFVITLHLIGHLGCTSLGTWAASH